MSAPPAPRSLIERLARHLATRLDVDWSTCLEDAASILAILKDPDAAMSAAGDAATWRVMIDAALTERWTIGAPLSATSTPLPAGSDEEGEIALSPEQVDQSAQDHAAWVHIHDSKGE
jgi:hypothetical protein